MDTTEPSGSEAGTSGTTSRRTLLRVGGNAAWAVPAIAVATAAPSFAASGTIVTTFSGTRTSSGEQHQGVVTNKTGLAATVTVSIVDVTPASGAGAGTITGGSVAPSSGWLQTYFNWSDGTGADRHSATYTITTTAPLAAGASLALPVMTFFLSGTTVTGTSTLTLSAPAPATVTQPAPFAFLGYTAPGARQAQKARTGFTQSP